jgi:peptide/nickel transport system ATP-binding protein
MSLLRIEDLRIVFEGYEGVASVLDGVDLEVHRNEIVGLAGETGCGKSVTMKAIMQVLPIPPARIASGRILFEDRDLLSIGTREVNKLKGKAISMIMQDPMASLNPVFKIRRQMTEVIKWARIKESNPRLSLIKGLIPTERNVRRKALEKQAIEVIKQVQLPDPRRIMNSYPFELSGGMCQRILIAMTLVNNPRLLIADEPGTALDVTIQYQILQMLKLLVSESALSVLLITHNLGVIREAATRCYIMYAGRITEVGDVNKIFETPLHPYTKGLLMAVPRMTGAGVGVGIPGMIPNYYEPPDGCRFRPRCPKADSRCQQKPEMIRVSEGYQVACWHVEEG